MMDWLNVWLLFGAYLMSFLVGWFCCFFEITGRITSGRPIRIGNKTYVGIIRVKTTEEE